MVIVAACCMCLPTVASSLSLGVVVIVFLKLVSYVQVNHWCRQSVIQAGKKSKEKLGRWRDELYCVIIEQSLTQLF